MSDGGKFFPEFLKAGDVAKAEGGITLRQFYFAQALKGLLSNPQISKWDHADPNYGKRAIEGTVAGALKIADKMIEMEEAKKNGRTKRDDNGTAGSSEG